MKKTGTTRQARHSASVEVAIRPDSWVLIPALLLLSIGIVMVGSASIAVAESQGVSSNYYLYRHLIYVFLGVLLTMLFRVIPIAFLERVSRPMLLLSALALLAVLVPGVGHTVNGSTRWIRLGLVNFQVVEAVKLMVIIYLAGYLARKAGLVQTRFFDTLKPLIFAGTD